MISPRHSSRSPPASLPMLLLALLLAPPRPSLSQRTSRGPICWDWRGPNQRLARERKGRSRVESTCQSSKIQTSEAFLAMRCFACFWRTSTARASVWRKIRGFMSPATTVTCSGSQIALLVIVKQMAHGSAHIFCHGDHTWLAPACWAAYPRCCSSSRPACWHLAANKKAPTKDRSSHCYPIDLEVSHQTLQ